ncbi:hypothetical protein WR25_15418 [Diploscapter pachys]|uniref:C2H2-type domain-containing protein n=1 Tax=Diploscapter pachys TaxID=2018661 RepID=A0A2A2LNM7_9BILA|nr:hypothetical protein WR25_15418 [Diploscapter pachys]
MSSAKCSVRYFIYIYIFLTIEVFVSANTIYVTMEIQGKEYYGIITEGEPPNVSQYLKKRNAAKNMLQEEDRERGGANTPTKKTSIGGTPKESAKRGPRFESRRKISRRNSENGDEDESDSEPAKKIHLREFDDRNDFHMCPHHGCNYKYRIPDQLEYHIAHSHTNKSKMYEDVATQTNVTGKCDKETNTVEILPSPSKTAIMNSLKSPTQFSDISDDTAAPELDKEGSFMNESSSSKRAASAMSMSNMTSTPIKKLQDNSPSKMDDPMQSARIAQGMPHSASTPILPSTAAMQMQGPGLSTLCSPPNLLVPSPFLGFPPSTFAMSQPRSSSASALHQAHKIHELRTNDASTSSSTDSPLPSSSNSTPSTSNQPPKQQSHQAQPQSRSSSAVPPSTSQPFPVPVMSSPTGPMAAPYFHPQHLLVRQGATTVTNSNIAPQLPFTMPVGTQQNQTEMAQFMAAMKHHGFYNPMFPK